MDRPRRSLQCVAYLDQVAPRIEKLSNHVWCSIIADLLPFSQKFLITILSQYIDDLLQAPEIEIDYKRVTEELLPELQTSSYRESLRKSCSVHPKLPISTISWGRGKRNLSQGGIAAILQIPTPKTKSWVQKFPGQLGSATLGKQAFWK